ncbi:MAG: IS256 family transposase [Ignavibacteriaceae bacterium]|nr:IS256 family transposase [Ignavibacteriaceae bacterium]
MQLSDELFEQFKKDLLKAKTYEELMGPDGAIKKMMKSSLEAILDAEMTEHLGYPKKSPEGNNSGNSRNGKYPKSVITQSGNLTLDIPRDRKGKFEPKIIPKHQNRLGKIEDQIISMYAKGISTRDIQSHLEEIYGVEVSPTLISQISDKISAKVLEWQGRELESVYPVIFFDAIHYKVRDESARKVVSKAAYTCLGINIEGHKDLLGIWIGEAEGATFWLNVITELRNRGVQELCIVCIDGLKGFPQAIQTVFPDARIQHCVVHQIRNSVRYIPSKHQREFVSDLKSIYGATTRLTAEQNLVNLENTWAEKYPLAVKSWKTNWETLSTFFDFPQEIRKMIYTTNAVESLHRQFRKITKNKASFRNDHSLEKILYLAYQDISKKWRVPVKNWSMVIGHLSIIFEKQIGRFLK